MAETGERNWVQDLASPDARIKDKAVAELRNYLLRGLRGAYAGKGVDESFCEDIAQDATIRVLDRMDQFEGRSRFTTWAMTIAIRMAVSEFRRKRFKDVSLEALAGEDSMRIEIPAVDAAPGNRELKKEVLEKLGQLVNTLSAKQKLATEALLNGMPVDVIAEKTGNNRNAVYKLIHDARKSLKKGMQDSGFEWADIHAAFGGGA